MRETRLINTLIFLSIFISSITFFKEPFEGYFHYIIFLLLFPTFLKRFGISTQTIGILLVPLIVGILEVMMGNNTWALFLKIFIGLLLSVSFYDYVLRYYKFDTEKIFRYYLKGAFIVCCIGLVQFVSYVLHFTPGYNYSWLFNKWGIVPGGFAIRLNSIFSEASQFAIVISPACFVAIHNLLPGTHSFALTRIQSIIILVALLLTTSTTGYIGLFIILILFVINYGQLIYFFIGVLVILFGSNILYNNVPEFRSRIDTSVGLWYTGDYSLENINSSSFVLYNNFHIAFENLKSNPLTGTGVGSHPIAFDKYSLTNQSEFLDIFFNKADGNSMFIRLMSETGLIGIIFIIVFMRRNFVARDKYDNENPEWIISNSLLVIIILYLLRQGNYFLNGFPFFMWMYYYVRKQKQQRIFNLENGIMEEETENEEEEEEEEERFSVGNENQSSNSDDENYEDPYAKDAEEDNNSKNEHDEDPYDKHKEDGNDDDEIDNEHHTKTPD